MKVHLFVFFITCNKQSQLLMDFQREIEDEKLRRLQILKQLESERARITMQKWTKDQDTSSCLSCKQEFTLFRRRVEERIYLFI